MGDFAFEDVRDFDDVDRGFVGAFGPGEVTAADGRALWDAAAWGFLAGECPPTAHPSLWRQGQLVARQGLYEVTDGVYQVRGLDLSNMTLIEGDRGVIVVDPLICQETAAAAWRLYRDHRGDRPVSALVYSHTRPGHFGGARGVLPPGEADGRVPVLAPRGFLAHAVGAQVYAGVAMARRAAYLYGTRLEKGPAGQIGCGAGPAASTGTVGLVPPTTDITRAGQEETVDGVRFVFRPAPGGDSPAGLDFLLPDRRALFMPENAVHTMHTVLDLDGGPVRDARQWSRHLDEALALYGESADVLFASHHWPTWGRERVAELLTVQRDLYAYLHDQTLRLANRGLTSDEIADTLTLPPALERSWAAHGYHATLNHHVKAVYQRYLGWFDGNPAHLWEHPPVEQARRYTEALGGIDATVAKAAAYADAGDPRFAATLLNHAVFADPSHTGARRRLAEVYRTLGHASENGTWRNLYLTGAQELLGEIAKTPMEPDSPQMLAALTVDELLDSIAVRLDGPRAGDTALTMDWHLTDCHRVWRLTLSNGALTHRSVPEDRSPGTGPADLTLTLTRPRLLSLLGGSGPQGTGVRGDPAVIDRLAALLDSPDPDFPIVTP
jgi:alkyl sulfatase BDS1-like metallo-beta-lactamase superfamily hydrolase